MTKEFTTKFFSWAKENNHDYKSIAKLLDNKAPTIKNWNSIGIPKGKQFACQAIMDASKQEPAIDTISIPFNPEEFELIENASHIVQTRIKEYCRRAIIARARQDAAPGDNTQISPDVTTHLRVAEKTAKYTTERKSNIIEPCTEANDSGGNSNTSAS